MAGVHAKAEAQVKSDDGVVEVPVARVLPVRRRSA